MKNTKKIVNGVMAFISMILLIFLDQAVKKYIDSNFKVGETTPVIKNVFHITYVVNEGAAWSSFSGKTVMLLSVTAVILVAVIYNAVRPVLIKSHLLTVTNKKKEQTA